MYIYICIYVYVCVCFVQLLRPSKSHQNVEVVRVADGRVLRRYDVFNATVGAWCVEGFHRVGSRRFAIRSGISSRANHEFVSSEARSPVPPCPFSASGPSPNDARASLEPLFLSEDSRRTLRSLGTLTTPGGSRRWMPNRRASCPTATTCSSRVTSCSSTCARSRRSSR